MPLDSLLLNNHCLDPTKTQPVFKNSLTEPPLDLSALRHLYSEWVWERAEIKADYHAQHSAWHTSTGNVPVNSSPSILQDGQVRRDLAFFRVALNSEGSIVRLSLTV
jgi:hypothetical protein